MDYNNNGNEKLQSPRFEKRHIKTLPRLRTIDCDSVTTYESPKNGLFMTPQSLIKKVDTDSKGTTYKRKKLNHSSSTDLSTDIKFINNIFKSVVLTPNFKALVKEEKEKRKHEFRETLKQKEPSSDKAELNSKETERHNGSANHPRKNSGKLRRHHVIPKAQSNDIVVEDDDVNENISKTNRNAPKNHVTDLTRSKRAITKQSLNKNELSKVVSDHETSLAQTKLKTSTDPCSHVTASTKKKTNITKAPVDHVVELTQTNKDVTKPLISQVNDLTEVNGRRTEKKVIDFQLTHLSFLKTLGTGTFGRVYLTQDTRTKETFAMKILKISDVVKQNQIEHVNSERSILQKVSHPYIAKLFWSCRDLRKLYMLLEYIPGGELFSYLRDNIKLPASHALFYVAEIICVFEYLHEQRIVYRDLKTENLLISKDGHLKFTDFGFSKYLPKASLLTYTLCGTPEYLSPECIQGRGYDYTCDWWALGILTYELLVGDPPFMDSNPFGLYQKIISGIVKYPDFMENTPEKNFVEKLLVVERSDRLGKGKNGIKDLKSQEWLQNVNWEHANSKLLMPPFIPDISSCDDTRYFDNFDETWPDNLGSELVTQKILKRFESWQEDFV